MPTKWIVMRYYTAAVDEPGKDRRRYVPRFVCDTEEQAIALVSRLSRAATVWYSLVRQELERQPPDYADHLANAELVLRAMDPDATHDSRYVVEPTYSYEGPTDDVTPVFEALMTAFSQVPNPPTNPFEALYRLIRDAG
jgi:hypothetical protein